MPVTSITSPGEMGATLGLAAGFAAGAAFAGAVGAALAGVAAVGVYVDHGASDAALNWINCAGDILWIPRTAGACINDTFRLSSRTAAQGLCKKGFR